METMTIVILLLILNGLHSSLANKMNLIVHTQSTTYRYCAESLELSDNQTSNVIVFGGDTVFIASSSLNACNTTDLNRTFPKGFNSRTLLVLFKHQCNISEHAQHVQELFGKGIGLMIVMKEIEPSWYDLTSSSLTIPISIPVLMFRYNDFIKMNQSLNGNTENISFLIEYQHQNPQKFYLTTLFMLPLVLVTVILGNFWAAHTFITKKNGKTKYKPSHKLSDATMAIITDDTIDSSLPLLDENLSPDSDHASVSMKNIIRAMNNISTAQSRLTAIKSIPIWIILLQSIWIVVLHLLCFYYRSIRDYIFPILFSIIATIALTVCLNRLSYFVPILRRYQISTRLPRKLKICRLDVLNCFSVFAFCLSITIVIVWYMNRRSYWAWILQDAFGVVISAMILSIARLDNMKYITILLVVMCLIDIVLVFITPYIPLFRYQPINTEGHRKLDRIPSVMEQFAIGVKANDYISPFAFILPKTMHQSKIDSCTIIRPIILGFGDVVIPGLLLTYCKIIDIVRGNRWPVYYIQSVISYVIGLLLTYTARYFMNMPQPALLYLVPCVLISTIITGFCRREIRELFTNRCFQENLAKNEKIIRENASFLRSELDRGLSLPGMILNIEASNDMLNISKDLRKIETSKL